MSLFILLLSPRDWRHHTVTRVEICFNNCSTIPKRLSLIHLSSVHCTKSMQFNLIKHLSVLWRGYKKRPFYLGSTHICTIRETPKTGYVLMPKCLQQDIIYLDPSIDFQLDSSPKGREVLKDHQEMPPDGSSGYITRLCKGENPSR